MLDLFVIVAAAFVVYYFTILRPRGLLNANAVFVYVQMIMALGSFLILDPGQKADAVYGYVLLVSLLIYFVVSAVALNVGPGAVPHPFAVVPSKPTIGMWLLIGVSVVIVIAYYQAVGYSALFRGLANSLSGGEADIAGQRLDSYSGDRYFYPGYVNQFKNVLLPSLTIVVLTYWRSIGRRHVVLTVGLIAISVFGLLGTGQRGAFVQFMATLVMFVYLFKGRRLPGGVVKLASLALAAVVVSTIALGRSNSSLSSNASLADRAYIAVKEFRDRVLEVEQFSAVAGFRYIYEQPIQWGREWLQALTGVLPSSRGTDLPNRIYEVLYGTPRGTAPPSVWGSIYHNLGWYGVLVVPALLAVALAIVTKKSLDGAQRSSLEAMGIAGTSISLGFWAAGGPEALLNTGLVVYVFIWWWGSRPRTVRRGAPDRPEAAVEQLTRAPDARAGPSGRAGGRRP